MESIGAHISHCREVYESGVTKSLEWRKRQLASLLEMMKENKQKLCESLEEDLGRTDHFSSQFYETNSVELEISYLTKHLKNLTDSEPLHVSIANKPGHAYLKPEPLGVVLIMSAWNFPVLTLLQPAAGAIAAGNCVVLKPSNIASHTSKCIAELISRYFPTKEIICVEGGVNESTKVLEERFDKIMYTGGSTVAKIVMAAAAKNLTPVDLELGGKNPCIVTGNVETDKQLFTAIKRIVWAKFAVNSGQVCLSPDYVMVHEAVANEFKLGLKRIIGEFFGIDPKTSSTYCRIVNESHLKRLQSILEGDKNYLYCGGEVDEGIKYMSPTVLDFGKDLKAFSESYSTKGEIFGPILPVVTYSGDLSTCISFINKHDKPLAMYLFGHEDEGKEIAERTSSGSVTINECVMQKAELGIPFGGVGMSGSGRYHGRYTFEAFSHYKPVLVKKLKHDLDARYPPYDDKKKKFFETVHAVMLGEKSALALAYGMLKYKTQK
jgi:aldehyde dehydrogenase (NAD+)